MNEMIMIIIYIYDIYNIMIIIMIIYDIIWYIMI